MDVTGWVMAWPNLMVELPATVGAPGPLVKGELGRETHDILARRNTLRGITQDESYTPSLGPDRWLVLALESEAREAPGT